MQKDLIPAAAKPDMRVYIQTLCNGEIPTSTERFNAMRALHPSFNKACQDALNAGKVHQKRQDSIEGVAILTGFLKAAAQEIETRSDFHQTNAAAQRSHIKKGLIATRIASAFFATFIASPRKTSAQIIAGYHLN